MWWGGVARVGRARREGALVEGVPEVGPGGVCRRSRAGQEPGRA